MKRCGELSPDGSICALPDELHLSHASRSGQTWPNVAARKDYERRPQRRAPSINPYRKPGIPAPEKKTLDGIKEMVKRSTPEGHVSTGVPLAAKEAWSKDNWVAETTATLSDFLHVNPTLEWTSPEDFWPLIDAPQGDMRAMSLVIQSALRAGWIREVGSRRLRDEYHTRDRVPFSMNKLVPIYRSTF